MKGIRIVCVLIIMAHNESHNRYFHIDGNVMIII